MNQRLQKANDVTILGLFLNIGLVILKFFAGGIAHSGAIVADAFHSLSDLSTDFALLWGVRAAAKPADADHQYGHGRIETMVSVGIGAVLFAVGGAIFFEGTMKVIHVLQGQILPRPGWFAFFAAVVSIILKEWLYQKTLSVGRETENQAVIANAWHHRSDAFSSIGVMIGILGAIILGDQWIVLDPLAAIVVSIFIMKAAFSIVGESFNELMEGALSDEQEKEMMNFVHSIEGVKDAHKLRTRRIGQRVAIEVHVCVQKDLDIRQGHDIATRVENILKEKFGPETFVSVHIEPFEEGRA